MRYVRGSKGSGIEAGSYGTVAAINSNANLLSVQMQSGELATYDPRRLTGVSVYRQVAQDFSVGDRIQFTAPDPGHWNEHLMLSTLKDSDASFEGARSDIWVPCNLRRLTQIWGGTDHLTPNPQRFV